MARRKNSSAKKSSSVLKFIAWLLTFVIISLGVLSAGYYLGYEQAKEELTKKEKNKEQRRLALLKKIEKISYPEKNTVNSRLKKVLEKETQEKKQTLKAKEVEAVEVEVIEVQAPIEEVVAPQMREIQKAKKHYGASHEYASDSLARPPLRVKREIKPYTSKKPRLAIIIDDVSTKSHVNAIKSLSIPITMSFLPPSAARPNSAHLASAENFYMVHLPMEAQSYSAEEPKTLRAYDSSEKIASRVAEIKRLFPKVRYINNHTGSKFTSNEVAVNRLVTALNKHNITFVDSRTTSKTTVPAVMKNFGLKYIARDVFLDHKMDKPYILGQIKRAVKIAKIEGLAIAIGHPHSNTILALHESKKLFKDIDLVLINKAH